MSANPPAGPGRAGRMVVRLLLGLALSLAVLASGHALIWRSMSSQLQAGFDDWAAVRRAQGWQVTHAPSIRGGWPLAATLSLPGFRLEGGGGTLPGGLEWQAEALMLRVALPRLDRLVVEAPGRNRLRLGGLDVPFAADRLAVILPLERDVLPSDATAEAEQLRIGTTLGAIEVRSARLTVETRITATEGEPAVTLAISATDILLPPGAMPVPNGSATGALGRNIDALALDLALTGPVPPGRGPTAKAEAWRDGGGTLELRALDVTWGQVSATSTATLTLDEALQPMGAGTLKVTGATAAVDAAATAGLLAPRAALGARAVARLLSRTPPEGGPPQLEVPLTLEGRTLTLARLPLAKLVAWTWPAPPEIPDAAQDPSLPARD